ncbi:MAG: T9SS type A sorting domain-containing protein [Chitinophagales bacterium]
MKKFLYFLFLIAIHSNVFAGCYPTAVVVKPKGSGKYLISTRDSLSTDSLTWFWTVNDTLGIDSNANTFLFKLDTNGTYQICLHGRDTAGCTFDTCVHLEVEDAVYRKTLDSVNDWWYVGNLIPEEMKPVHGITKNLGCYNVFGFGYGNLTTGEDSMWNGLTYKKLSFKSFNPICTVGWIREDTVTRKIFLYPKTDTTEYLIADFSGTAGDTIDYIDPRTSLAYRLHLDSVIAATYFGKTYRVFYLTDVRGWAFGELQWTEGLISFYEPLLPMENYSSFGLFQSSCGATGQNHYNRISILTCFSHQQGSVYFDSCSYRTAVQNPNCFAITNPCNYRTICGGIAEPDYISDFKVGPNPASNGTAVLQLEVAKAADYIVLFTDLQGREHYKSEAMHLGEGTGNVVLQLPEVAGGLYFITIKTAGFSASRKLIVEK